MGGLCVNPQHPARNWKTDQMFPRLNDSMLCRLAAGEEAFAIAAVSVYLSEQREFESTHAFHADSPIAIVASGIVR